MQVAVLPHTRMLYQEMNKVQLWYTVQGRVLKISWLSVHLEHSSSISELLTIQRTRSTGSSAVVTLQCPSNPSQLKISGRSFYYQAPVLGILYHTIIALILWRHLPKLILLFSHCLFLNFISSLKLTLFFNPILLSLAISLLNWPLRTLNPACLCHSLFNS